MTLDAQRITIAEACGWKDCKLQANPLNGEINWFAGIDPIAQCEQSVPDYLSDLNAMHEAEKKLTPRQRVRYTQKLSVCATAVQRAEAFLQTLGK